ncbi:MAG: UTP--glucose-1-phosphate uridylyltransferase [Patescibacteria group bacterium]|jgi:UTP--glucose-1-phosphate uridylyltransferase
MPITKAIIAAAGRGTRFLPVVKAYPKELIPLLSKPNIQLLIEEAIGAGITDIMIVQRQGETAIERYFTPDVKLEKYLSETNKTPYLDSLKRIWSQAKIHFTFQSSDLPYGNASPLLASREFIGQESFVYMFGDDLTVEPTPGQYLKELINTYDKYQPAVLLGGQYVPWEEINRYGSMKFIEDKKYPQRVTAVLEKMEPNQAPSNFAQGGRFVVSGAKIFPVLDKQRLSRDNELWFADANNTLAQTDVVMAQEIKDGTWLTTGDPLRWLKANIALALQDPDIGPSIKDYLKSLHI